MAQTPGIMLLWPAPWSARACVLAQRFGTATTSYTFLNGRRQGVTRSDTLQLLLGETLPPCKDAPHQLRCSRGIGGMQVSHTKITQLSRSAAFIGLLSVSSCKDVTTSSDSSAPVNASTPAAEETTSSTTIAPNPPLTFYTPPPSTAATPPPDAFVDPPRVACGGQRDAAGMDATSQESSSSDGGALGASMDGAAGSTELDCAPPPSYCLDSQFLAYFVNGRCENGICAWDQETMECGDICSNGGCQSSFTF